MPTGDMPETISTQLTSGIVLHVYFLQRPWQGRSVIILLIQFCSHRPLEQCHLWLATVLGDSTWMTHFKNIQSCDNMFQSYMEPKKGTTV
jgi:hypothetical protein